MELKMKLKLQNYFPFLAGILSSIIFGFSFLFTKIGLGAVNNEPFDLIAGRFAVAALLLLLMKLMGKTKLNYKGKKLRMLFLLSFFQPVLYFIFETYGIKLTSSSEAGTMIALIPVMVTILAAIFLKEKPALNQVIFILISLSGILLINLPKFEGKGNILGMFVLLATITSAAIYSILSRKLSTIFTPIECTYVMMWQGAIVFNAVSIIKHINSHSLSSYFLPWSSSTFLISVLYLGGLSSVIAFFLLNYMYSKLRASAAASFSNITTVVSIFAGVLILKESFEPNQIIGIVIILIGVWGTNHFEKIALV
jgi:drug/metabolite transporter (DMT)-like permease